MSNRASFNLLNIKVSTIRLFYIPWVSVGTTKWKKKKRKRAFEASFKTHHHIEDGEDILRSLIWKQIQKAKYCTN